MKRGNVKKNQHNHVHNHNIGTVFWAQTHNSDMRLEFIALIM